MLYIVESRKSVQEIERQFPQVTAKHKFGVLAVHNLRQKMNEKGVPFQKDCIIFEVCNPQQASQVLQNHMEISTVLPCRISVYEEDGKTKIATVKPTALMHLYRSPELIAVAQVVEYVLFEIMQEVAG